MIAAPKFALPIALLCFFLLGAVVKHGRPHAGTELTNIMSEERTPASTSLSCFELLTRLDELNLRNENQRSIFRFLHSHENFNAERYYHHRSYYEDVLSRRGLDGLTTHEAPRDHEAVLAFIDVLGPRGPGLEIGPRELELTQRTQRRLHTLTGKILRERRLLFTDLQGLLADLYTTAHGKGLRAGVWSLPAERERELVSRLVKEDLAVGGLTRALTKYHDGREALAPLREFTQSRYGTLLATSIFNLPVLSGFPPLFIPGLAKRRLPPELAREIMTNGLGVEQYRRVEEVLRVGPFRHTFQARYEMARSYYMVGAAIAFTLYYTSEVIQEELISRQERALLDSISTEIGEFLAPVIELQDRHPACLSLENCFASLGVELDNLAQEPVAYGRCKSLFDRRNQCADYPPLR
jgi:hypothetical protein